MEVIKLVAATIVVVGIIAIVISKKMNKSISPFLIFAIVDILFGLLFLGYAIYDFNTSVGEFAGILGQLTLLIGEPIVGVLLIIDIIVWVVWKKKKEK